MINRLILVGYRGSGKSTIGRIIANRLGRNFIDADHEIEKAAGKTIRDIFAQDGEQAFRDLEAANLEQLCRLEDTIIATGGGVILRPANRELLKKNNFVVWLTATPETLWKRIQTDTTTAEKRPALSSGGLEEVKQMLAIRDSLYREVANFEISVEEISPEDAATAILAEWRGQ